MNFKIRSSVRAALGMTAMLATTAPQAISGPRPEPAEIPFGVAELFFELNNTDGDLGIHAKIDGEPWKQLSIVTPNDALLLQVLARGGLRRQGMNELLFESAEPNFSELPPNEFLRRFPEGMYEVEAIALEGHELESEVRVSHVIPAPVVPLSPTLATCAAPVAATAPVTIRWSPVTTSHPHIGIPGQPIEVERYELALERLDGSGLKMSVELPPDVTAFVVPANFTSAPGTVKFQMLVKAAGGNRTGEESCFAIR
jgi:hypothetical protein